MNVLLTALLTAAAPFLAGCATQGGGALSSSMVGQPRSAGGFAYMPTQAPSTRLPAERLPRLMIGKVSDESGGGEFHGPTGYRLNVRWSDVVRDALTTELGRVNWPTTRTPDLAGATLKASVTKVSATWNAGFMVKVLGEIRIILTLRDPSGQDVWEGELVGNGLGTAGGGGIPGNGIKESLGVALPDVMAREGVHPETPPTPFTPGWDLVGTVDRLGEGVSEVKPGQTVAALPIHGAYAEFMCLPQRELVPVPSGLDPAEAVSLTGKIVLVL